jgi:transcription elongation GreA/GreB family factor
MENTRIEINEEERSIIFDLILPLNPKNNELVDLYSEFMFKLKNAKVNYDQVPDKVISLGKTISIKTSFGSKSGITIVLPKNTNVDQNKYSVFSILGCTLFGHKEGDIVRWKSHRFIEEIEILSVR